MLASCESHTPKGFTEIQNGIAYKLVIAGDGKLSPSKGDFVKINARGKGLPSYWEKYRDEEGLDTFTIGLHKEMVFMEQLLQLMNEGDSCVFICDPVRLNNSIFKTKTELGIRLLSHKTAEQVKKETLSHELWLKERYEDENRLLMNYLQENYKDVKPESSGLAFIEVSPGAGPSPVDGDNVLIEYSASFLSGKEFYSTKNNEPFDFTVGQHGQVLNGLELGIKRMRQGGKARLIVPSYLAFGEKGASTGIVGPFKTIIFDIELLKINHKPNS